MDVKQLGAGWQRGRMSDGNGLHHLTPPQIIIIIITMIIVNNGYCQMKHTHLIDVARICDTQSH